jgi:L-asparaginase / beta-aspartyl-peptidase
MIAVDADGNVAAPFNTHGMKRGIASSSGLREVKTW